MPVVKMDEDIGTKWKMGQVVMLPKSTLKQMARNAGRDDYTDFCTVIIHGGGESAYMEGLRKETRVESARTPSARISPAPKKGGRDYGGKKKATRKMVKK